MQEFPEQSGEMPQAMPIVPLSLSAPDAPLKAPRRSRISLLLGLAGILVLAGGFSGLLFFHNHATSSTTVDSAQDILNQAAAAPLHDTSFTLALNVNSQIGNTTVTIKGTGNGAIITQPFLMQMTFNIDGFGGTNLTETFILDSTDLYFKLPSTLSGSKGKSWTKISLASLASLGGLSGSSGGAPTSDFLDYTKLHNPQNLGAATIDGYKTWHLRATMSDLLSAGGLASTATAVSKQLGVSATYYEDLWIRQDTKYPVQIVVHETATVGGTSTSTAQPAIKATIVETLTFTKWNSGVIITLPPPSQIQTTPSLFPTPAPTPHK